LFFLIPVNSLVNYQDFPEAEQRRQLFIPPDKRLDFKIHFAEPVSYKLTDAAVTVLFIALHRSPYLSLQVLFAHQDQSCIRKAPLRGPETIIFADIRTFIT